jgi:hypothetical protein
LVWRCRVSRPRPGISEQPKRLVVDKYDAERRTAHCRAGWAIELAGKAGRDLEKEFGSNAAGALIYAASRPGQPIPNFFVNKKTLMNDIKACAQTQV